MSTIDKLQTHLSAPTIRTYSDGYGIKDICPSVKCKDGSTMSIQASEMHFCSPRSNYGPWLSLEVWCCGTLEEWEDLYGDGEGGPYGGVPIEKVAAEIDRRGGFAD